jgi:hypothetical protein
MRGEYLDADLSFADSVVLIRLQELFLGTCILLLIEQSQRRLNLFANQTSPGLLSGGHEKVKGHGFQTGVPGEPLLLAGVVGWLA